MHSSLGRFVRLEIKTNVLRTSLIAVLGWGLIPIVFTLTPQSLAQAAMPTESVSYTHLTLPTNSLV